MTIELITGHAGSAHVSSADAGWFNAGIIGQESYILETGNQFEATEQSANLVTIGTGDAVFHGRHVRVSAPENVSIDNGAHGMKRNDIICIKYVNSNSVESASLEVVKGTATSGTPTDPTIPSGDILDGATEAYMPLWRIPVNGIALEDPVKLYGDTITPLNELSGTLDVSKIPPLPASVISSGVLPIARGGTGSSDVSSVSLATDFMLHKWGKLVFASAKGVSRNVDTPNATSFGFTIPDGYRPIGTVEQNIVSTSNGSRITCWPNGYITYFGDTLPAYTQFWFSAVWMTA